MSLPPGTEAARVFALIDREALARDLLAFLEVRSETAAEAPGSEFLAALLQREGFEPAFDEAAPARPNVYARVAGRGGGPCLAINGHVDTIPIGRAWPPRREGEEIVGRGAEDMKGGLVAMVHAMAALRRAGVALRGDVWLTGVVGHEAPVGKKEGPDQLIRRLRERAIPADAILIVEGPPKIWAASLGSAIFHLRLEADREPIHTSRVPYKENPVRWLARLLDEVDRLDDRLATAPEHPLAGRDRVNVGIVAAGDYMNRLPVSMVVTGTRRWTPGQTAATVRAELEALVESVARLAGLRGRVELEAEREPFETPADHPLVTALRRAGEAATGQPPEIIGLAIVGDANLYANDAGVPTVYYGPRYHTAHSDDERLPLDDLERAARVYALAALEYCGVARS